MTLLSIAIIIGTILFGAKLWRMGGDGQKWARLIAFPSLLAIAKLVFLAINLPWSWWFLIVLLYMPALWGLLSLFSYGISAPPHKFWVWVFGTGETGNVWYVELATRATCGFFWSLAALTFTLITGEWFLFGIYVPFLTIANGLIGAFVHDVETSERGVGACVATSIFV